MSKPSRKYPLWAMALAVLGAALFAISFLVLHWYDWKPMSFPIDLRLGVTRSPVFRVNLETNYDINLEVDRTMPLEQLNCLLGISENPCKDATSLRLTWATVSNGVTVAEGATDKYLGAEWGPTVARTIGHFRAEKRRDYIIEVRSLRDASTLAPAAPRITVQAPSTEYSGFIAIAQFLAVTALLFGGAGIIWIGVWWFTRRRVFNNA